jgi:hypothetical protein
MNQVEQLAVLNNIIYEDKKNWKKELKKYGMNDWRIDPLSKDNTMVLTNSKTKELRVIHSGTDLVRRKWEDLATDAFITADLTTLSPRYNKSKKLTEKAIAKHPEFTPVVSGFSLGASIGAQISHELDTEFHGFNGGHSPLLLTKRMKQLTQLGSKKEADPKRHMYITKGDIISNAGILGVKGNETVHVSESKKDLKPHDIANWMPNVAVE